MTTTSTAQNPQSPIGHSTMSPAMSQMVHYPRYLLGKLRSILGQRVLEIGVGNGQYTRELLAQGRSVLATDIDANCLDELRHTLNTTDRVHFAPIDLENESTVSKLSWFRADTVICFNVLEHISNDERALRAIRESVDNQAKIGLIVPAHGWLFGQMDREAGHFRRYSRSMLKSKLMDSGWVVEKVAYINLFGAAGWFYHNRLRQNAGLADKQVNNQMQMVDKWLPRLGFVTDPIFGPIAGLSVLAIGRAAN
jgi:SAM-dependent methyltransferase